LSLGKESAANNCEFSGADRPGDDVDPLNLGYGRSARFSPSPRIALVYRRGTPRMDVHVSAMGNLVVLLVPPFTLHE
jgi:hypothetical protein